MRWTILLLVILASCAPSVQHVVDQDTRVQGFLNLVQEAAYGEEQITSNPTLEGVCGNLPEKLIRAHYTTPAATMYVYVVDREVRCVTTSINREAFIIEQGDPTTVPEGTVAMVNNEVLTREHLASIEEQQSDAYLLQLLIDQLLIEQASRNVPLFSEELQVGLEGIAPLLGHASAEELQAGLGEEYLPFLERFTAWLKFQKLLAREGITKIDLPLDLTAHVVTENTASFRQIFLGFTNGYEDANQRRASALIELRDGADFCDVLQKYTDDVESIPQCGSYTLPHGILTPELEAALFSLRPGDLTVVETGNGFHIIHLDEFIAQAEPRPPAFLHQLITQRRLDIFLLQLRAAAEITIYI